MKKTQLGATGKSDDAGKTEQPSSLFKNAAVPRRVNFKMVPNVLLIWLDSNINNNSVDCQNTITQLRRVVNTINTFTDDDQCLKFINTITDNKACMIISGSLGERIVPRVHSMSQVNSIFIFCSNKKHHEQWAKEWPKIEGVFTEISPICEALKRASQRCERNATSISFVTTSGDTFSKNFDRLDSMFIYTQIMKEIILTIEFKLRHFNEFIDHCRDEFGNNQEELVNINNFEKKYRDKTPIWWYTSTPFLYTMVNCALRMANVDTIIKMGFFISDLHRQIAELHNKQFGNHQIKTTFTVYRGQGLSKTDFDRLMKTKGGLMSFNNFLSTSYDRTVGLYFARHSLDDPNLMGILCVMKIDPSKSTTLFASIKDISYYAEKEEEVLFTMHTVFRIDAIKPMNENQRLFQVDLTLTSEDDRDLRILTNRIREETFPQSSGWYRLGSMLIKMGQPDLAEQVYQVLLDETIDDSKKASIYHQLGVVKYHRREYKEAIVFYENSLQIRKKLLPPDHPDLAKCYNNIGNVYEKIGDQQKALSFYEKALQIKQQSLPSNDISLAASYCNIGSLYGEMRDYAKALPYFEKDLEISKKSLSSNDPDLATSYSNLAVTYENLGHYLEARSYYQRAIDIGQQSLPPNHPDLQKWKRNLDKIKKKS